MLLLLQSLDQMWLLMIVALLCTGQSVQAGKSMVNDVEYHVKKHRGLNHKTPFLQVTSIQLIDATTSTPILNFTAEMNNTVINLAKLNTTGLTILAEANDEVVSVVFGLDSNKLYRIESSPPYAICSNSRDLKFFSCPWLGVVGNYTIRITPYSGNQGTGNFGTTRTISLSVVNKTIPLANITTCKIPKFIDDRWENAPANPISAAEPHGLMVGGDLIFFGGFYDNFQLTRNETFARRVTDVNNNVTWRRMGDLPHPIGITHTPSVAVGKKVYMCGGYVGRTPGPETPLCYIYDHGKLPRHGQWTQFQSLPGNGTGGAGLIYDKPTNALYYVGGANRPKPGVLFSIDTNKVWKYSLSRPGLGWVESVPIPYLGNHISYVTAKDRFGRSRHYLLGGQIGENEALGNLRDVFEFVPSKERWIRRASMPYGRSHTTASTRAIGCGFFVAGGAVNDPDLADIKRTTTNDISYYDIPTNKWTSIGNLSWSIVTPLVDYRDGYMYFVNTRNRRGYRRRISFEY